MMLLKQAPSLLLPPGTKVKKPKAPAADLTWMGYVGETVPEEYTKIIRDEVEKWRKVAKAAGLKLH